MQEIEIPMSGVLDSALSALERQFPLNRAALKTKFCVYEQRRQPLGGATKCFEAPFVNDMWMTDFSPGPYLQREIRAQRRNVGALKLSNLLQPDCFEEDLQISRVRLPPPQPAATAPLSPPALPLLDQQQGPQRALQCLRQIKAALR
jgi:hypothetical protein